MSRRLPLTSPYHPFAVSTAAFHQNLFIMRVASKVITFSSAMVMLVNNKSESQIFRESLEWFFSLQPNEKSDDHGGSGGRVRVTFNMQDSKLEGKIARVNAQTKPLKKDTNKILL